MTEIDFTPEIIPPTGIKKVLLLCFAFLMCFAPIWFANLQLNDYSEKTARNPLWPEPWHSIPAIILLGAGSVLTLYLLSELFPITRFWRSKRRTESKTMKELSRPKEDSGEYIEWWIQDLKRYGSILFFIAIYLASAYFIPRICASVGLPRDQGAESVLAFEIGAATIWLKMAFFPKL